MKYCECFFRTLFCVNSFIMPRRRKQASLERVSESVRGRTVVYKDCGLTFREIGDRGERYEAILMRMCNHWMHENTTDLWDRLHPTRCTTTCDDRYIVHMKVMDCSVTSRTISQKIQSVSQQSISAFTVRQLNAFLQGVHCFVFR